MGFKKLRAVYHVDINPEEYLEITVDSEDKRHRDMADLYDGKYGVDFFLCDFLIVDNKDGSRYLWNELFMLDDAAKTLEDLFDANLFRLSKRFKGMGFPGLEDEFHEKGKADVSYRWLYYKREYAVVMPLLRMWGHAKLKVDECE